MEPKGGQSEEQGVVGKAGVAKADESRQGRNGWRLVRKVKVGGGEQVAGKRQ